MARARQFPPSVDPGLPTEPTVPTGWLRTTFGEVLAVVERAVSLEDDREYLLVTAKRSRGGIVARERLRGREILVKTQFEIRAGDFLISRRQIVHGACGIVPAELSGAIVSNEYAVLIAKPGLELEYLKYLSHTPYFQRTCFHSSVGIDVEKMVFKLEDWFRFPMHLPPGPEQRHIVATLGAIDANIAASEKALRDLQLVRAAAVSSLLSGQRRALLPDATP